jgi:signal peptidase
MVRLLNGLGLALVGIICGSAIVVALSIGLLGYRSVVVMSDSMVPVLRRGDLVLTRPVPIAAVNVGDVILFREGVSAQVDVIHRVVAVMNVDVVIHHTQTGLDEVQHSRVLQTRGDAASIPDGGRVTADRLEGAAFLTLPGVGSIATETPLRAIMLGAAALTALLWVAFEARGIRRVVRAHASEERSDA